MSGAESRLRAATTLAALEAVLLIALVFFRNGLRTPLLALALALKLPFCVLARRLHAGGFLALLLWEGVGAIVAVTAPRVALGVRTVELLLAVTVIGLLLGSMSLFPTPRLPDR